MSGVPITWLTEELMNRIRCLFEPRYGRALSDGEVVLIADNLTSLFEVMLKPGQYKKGFING
ncbi:TPA: hypothetical protein DEP93_02285 [candidate division WWE3 bacterium]|uniref:Uncharacterized protein n=2 Tax=Katanobacteria TaxID=422282 RepID=A0A0G0YS80_UNCKA|nr:MAG: hypothetical protein UR43_C0017G0007 [candidate division TM6 bacterium GW2011_GWF2_33_332]KKS03218.1 MAG: hypothetical protein UU55_C0004G0007 [candidate division WWE3 bacterium GW2011_GWC2_41_23]HCC42276.1 hypothetical protein [candidate division WWE3 bacterium]